LTTVYAYKEAHISTDHSRLLFSVGGYLQETDFPVQETITGQLPYAGEADHAVVVAVAVRKEIPRRPEDHIPSESDHGDILWEMLKRCWSPDPKARPRASEAVAIVSSSTFMPLSCAFYA
jgi:hypothetical protein